MQNQVGFLQYFTRGLYFSIFDKYKVEKEPQANQFYKHNVWVHFYFNQIYWAG